MAEPCDRTVVGCGVSAMGGDGHAGGAACSPLSSLRVAALILGSVARKPKRSCEASTSLTYPSSRRPRGGPGRQGRRVVATA